MYNALFFEDLKSRTPLIEDDDEEALLRAAVAIACVSKGSNAGSITHAGQKGNVE